MEYDSKKYKSILIEMMRTFHVFCQVHDLRYTLCGGSLLGAVRHKGIIPWDDDIDIIMPRPDYTKLLSFSPEQFVSGYKVVHAQNTPHYYLPYAKVIDCRTSLIESRLTRLCPIGVFLDIFPIDAAPEDEITSEKLYKQYVLLKNKAKITVLNYDSISRKNSKTWISNIIFFQHQLYRCIYSSKKLFEKCEQIASSIPYGTTTKLRIYTSAQFSSRVFDKYVFDDFFDMEFDGITVKGIREYDTYLTSCYKDYMQLPPVEKRESHHSQYFIDLDKHITIDEIHRKGF